MKKAIDMRTVAGRQLKDTARDLKRNLDVKSAELLRKDIANNEFVMDLIVKQIAEKPEKFKSHIPNFLKTQASTRSSLLALKKFEKTRGGGIADLFKED